MVFCNRSGLNQLAVAAAVVALSAANVKADTINISTGLDSSGNVYSVGDGVDANWTYSDSFVTNYSLPATGSAKTIVKSQADWFGGWVPNSTSADWIAPDPDVTNNGPAPYFFTRTFSLAGYNVSTASLAGSWTIDDGGTIDLNGHLLSSLGDGNWGSLTPISAPSSDFVSGLNTLTVTMTDDDEYLEGTIVTGAVTVSAANATPEPGALALLAASGLGVLGLRRRRNKA